MTAASDSLKDATKTKDDTTDLVRALEIMMGLNADQKQRYLEFLKKSLDDFDVWKPGSGVPDDYAAKSRNSLKRNEEVLQESLEQAFPDFTPELQQRIADLFYQCVSQQTLSDALQELFRANPQFSLLFGEQLDVAELLANHIQNLEGAIASVKEENYQIATEIETLDEETMFPQPRKSQKLKRSYIDEDMLTADEENSIFLEENQKQHSGDPTMRRYADFLERTTRGNDARTPASDLMET